MMGNGMEVYNLGIFVMLVSQKCQKKYYKHLSLFKEQISQSVCFFLGSIVLLFFVLLL